MTDEGLKRDEMIEILEGRAGVYSFLASVYGSEPTPELLVHLREHMCDGPQEGSEGQGHTALRRFLLTIDDENVNGMKTELAADYARLFLGMSRRPVPPYASVYTTVDQLMKQDEYDKVRAEYRAEGMARAEGFKEPEDHIALEMEFMAYLCRNATEAIQSEDLPQARHYLEKQRTFLIQHLLNWVPQFCRDVRRAARTDFYKGIAGITEDHLAYEPEAIDELLAGIG